MNEIGGLSLYEVFLVSRFERKILYGHLRAARKAGSAATLTMEQWRDAVYHFNWRCAYCEENAYGVLEHFVPISQGGGTTASNCVPACQSCNVRKSQGTLSPEVLHRVQAYLERDGCNEQP